MFRSKKTIAETLEQDLANMLPENTVLIAKHGYLKWELSLVEKPSDFDARIIYQSEYCEVKYISELPLAFQNSFVKYLWSAMVATVFGNMKELNDLIDRNGHELVSGMTVTKPRHQGQFPLKLVSNRH